MSDELGKKESKLCITETAFEQFQESAMYEEDELLTLSDLVPPEPYSDGLSVMNDLMDHDEPVSTEVEINQNSKGKESELVDKPDAVHAEVENETVDVVSIDNVNVDSAQVNGRKTRKRGRKKKTLETNDLQANLDSLKNENSLTFETPMQRKRGRPSRKFTQQNVDVPVVTENNPESLETSLDSLKKENSLIFETPNQRKRGRPSRKSAQQNLYVPVVTENNPESSGNFLIQNNQIDQIEVSKTSPPKRGRRKKVYEETITNGDEMINNSQVAPEKSPLPKISPLVKRGRRSKKHAEEIIENQSYGEEKAMENHTEPAPFQEQDDDEDGDDICLSDLRRNLGTLCTENFENTTIKENTEITEEHLKQKAKATKKKIKTTIDKILNTNNTESNNVTDNSINVQKPVKCSKRKPKKTVMSDYEYNIDKAIDENVNNIGENANDAEESNIKTEESTHTTEENIQEQDIQEEGQRPKRRKARKKYEIESDEDPFAGDDDEYIPGGKQTKLSSEDSSIDSALDEDDNFLGKPKRKKTKKMGLFDEIVTTVKPDATCSADDDIEVCLETSVIKASEDLDVKLPKWNSTREFESFLAKKSELQIKKVSSSEPTNAAPLTIPTIDPNKEKKMIETSSQTNVINKISKESQTEVPGAFKIKDNLPLTIQQSNKACEFLKSIVQTTSELGQLMIQKSEDFIKKKINTDHVTDTLKIDYCIQKSMLLFKLAKHNLTQMEDDLTKQYANFLSSNNLSHCRQEQKSITPKTKVKNEYDSDCEIVEVPSTSTKSKKSFHFNPKTVFLNKELSIKIAKKPEEVKKKENLNLKERHSVWISDSVMVKKVKPSQSFLAQDSRNKKPPDCFVTEKMVNEFFKDYQRQRALQVCAPFVKISWIHLRQNCECFYFFLKPEISNMNGGDGNEFESDFNEPSSSGIEDRTDLCDVKCNPTNTSEVKSLSQLCLEVLSVQLLKQKAVDKKMYSDTKSPSYINEKPVDILYQPDSLLLLSLRAVNTIGKCIVTHNTKITPTSELLLNDDFKCEENLVLDKSLSDYNAGSSESILEQHHEEVTKVKSLLTLCVNYFQKFLNSTFIMEEQQTNEITYNKFYSPDKLKAITYRRIINLMFNNTKLSIVDKTIKIEPKIQNLSTLCFKVIDSYFNETLTINTQESIQELAIDCINTLTEEAFLSIDNREFDNESEVFEDMDNDCDSFYSDPGHCPNIVNNEEENQNSESWVSQLQNELKCCFVPTNNQSAQEGNEENILEDQTVIPDINHIKLEPIEEPHVAVELMNIKTEPELDEMAVLPDNIITKMEHLDNARDPIETHGCNFDEEHLVNTSRNKMGNEEEDGIFSQSALRVRRQYDPDSDNENEVGPEGYGLLVPQTFEELKETLMESSESESENKKSDKAKSEKRRGRPKKGDKKGKSKEVVFAIKPTAPESIPLQQPAIKEKEKEKGQINEVTMLTRRMKEKIHQEEKKIESSDSENETLNLRSRKDKSIKPKTEKRKLKKKGNTDSEIQCNDVDSTEKVSENNTAEENKSNEDSFTGFSAVDQNETSSYEKYVKFIYDKILPSDNNKHSIDTTEGKVNPRSPSPTNDDLDTPLINPDEPVELLECEPTMPIFDNESETKKPGRKATKKKASVKHQTIEDKVQTENVQPIHEEYIIKDGWHCYPVGTDSKLYESSYIPLEKLPETFVETYFMYQNITEKDTEDIEIDRLTNLQSLNRSAVGKETKTKSQQRTKQLNDEQITSDLNSFSRPASPAYSDHYAELTPSEDEGANVEDEAPPLVPLKSSENHLAKNALMNDNESDEDTTNKAQIKQEPETEAETPVRKYRPGPKSKTKIGLDQPKIKVEKSPDNNLMLTADKMMGKELALLHAPVTLNEDVKDIPVKQSSEKKHSSGSKRDRRERHKSGDDSSSEEEKQWANKKEKLLKSMERKQEVSVDDAKRAKLESDFIKRRGDTAIMETQHKSSKGRRRSRRKWLEREKQMSVLSRELFGDNILAGKKSSQASFGKGRKNIRKVIDKKSLARSTVIANMEEFERKRRLNIKQTRLREVLGCEEGVNVLVINDEVCLEYDFDQHMPVVTIHPFFTRVMKAHQYEGVKFMWDACFESLEMIESGHPGGGCILAHCMGLGKTLQVLALLHTVLTHPRVGMQRVLVCCPLSTVLNWVDEIHKWIGPVTNQIKVFELSKMKKTYERALQLQDWYNGGGIFIIGYELFRTLTTLDPELDDIRPTTVNKIRTALLDPGPDIIICDEGHLLKNDCSVLAIAMSRVQTKRRIVLTGTPMQNNLREYYCMVNFVKPNLLGTYSEYSNRFENPIMNGQHRDSQQEDIKLMKARTHILHKVLEGCLQRQEASVLYPYLPKKHEYTVFITLTKVQVDLYKYYLDHYARKNKVQVLKDFQILQKIWTHPHVLDHFMKPREQSKIKVEKLEDDLAQEDITATEDVKPAVVTEKWWLDHFEENTPMEALESSNKFVAVFQILDECVALGDKVLIFSTSLFTMDSLEYFLQKINNWSLGQEYYRLDGKVPAEVRQKWCREFNAEHNTRTKLFLISTRAGSLGLNMVAANRVIILDTSWNPAHDIQSIFRVYRFGQKKDCYIYRLVALGTMEQKIYERSVTKQAISCRVVDEQQIDRHYNSTELTELYSLDETGCGVAAGVAAGVEDVVLLRVARSAALHAAHEHDSLLRGSTEQQLPEDERHEAWMQFQQEQAHKQIQNQLGFHYGETKHNLKRHLGQQPNQPLLYGALSHQYGGLPAYVPYSPQDHQYAQQMLPPHHQYPQQIVTPQPLFPQYPVASTSHGPPMVHIKTENDQLPLMPPLPGPKAKKGRPSKQNTAPVGVQEQPKQVPIPIQMNEAAMVEKISTILLEHQFHQNHKPSEIAALIKNVRQLIKSGKVSKTENDLAHSIARIIMAEEQAAVPQMPPLTDVQEAPEPKPNITELPLNDIKAKRSRGRPKKEKNVDEYVPPPQNIRSAKHKPIIPSPGVRGRRKAALIAEQSFDSLTSDAAVDMDNDGDWVVSDDLPIKQIKTEKEATETITPDVDNAPSPRERPGPKSKKKGRKSAHAEKSIPLPANDASVVPATPIEEIQNIISLIDDDDDELLAEKTIKIPKSIQPKEKEVEKVPLHPSLLSNKNFIKIVAHTYVTGNPMLDDDAALLAAQYSTLKALKEIEGTGKVIDSGPIYDIAIKVLGIEILQKLHKTGGAQENEDPKAAKAKKSQEVLVKSEAEQGSTKASRRSTRMANEPTIVKTENDSPVSNIRGKIKPKLTSLLMPQSTETLEKPSRTKPKTVITIPKSAIVPPPPVPVPVMINRASNKLPVNHPETITGEECILPDDDDVIISDSKPTQQQSVQPTIPSIPLHGSSQQQTLRISTSARVNSKTVNLKHHTLPPNQASRDKTSDEPICLDSDEESPPTPQPVPVALQPAQPNSLQVGALNPNSLRNYHTQLPQQLLQNLPKQLPQQTPQQSPEVPVNTQPTRTSTRRQRKLNIPSSAVMQSIDLDDNEATPANASQAKSTPAPGAPNILNNMLPSIPYSQITSPLLSQTESGFTVIQQSGQIVNQAANQQNQSDTPLQGKQAFRICKPGDIIRINKGHVELLNRSPEINNAATNIPPKLSTENQTLRKSARKSAIAEKVDYTSSVMVTTHKKKEEPKPPEPQKPAKETPKSNQTKPQKVDSSSSDSSRESSPERSEDPLSIFQNVVHIQAADEPKNDAKLATSSRSASKQSLLKPPSQSVITPSTSKSGQNTDLLKKLKDIKVLPSSNTIDLTDSSTPSNSVSQKSNVGNKSLGTASKPGTTFIMKKLPISANAKTITFKSISGTSKDIILKSGSGKPTLISTAASGSPEVGKKILVTNMETIKNLETKKRSLPAETNAPKKKKLSDMTLKDFDIDDIDDIIELE